MINNCNTLYLRFLRNNLEGADGSLFFLHMSLKTIEDKIIELLEEKFRDVEFSDCFLVEINHSGKKLGVFLDSDQGITFGTCKKISRYLEEFLDESGIIGNDYILEVSSAGVGQPLKMPRQYIKNIGRLLEVQTTDGKLATGKMLEADESKVTIEYEVKEKIGKKNVKRMVSETFDYSIIKKAIIKISF